MVWGQGISARFLHYSVGYCECDPGKFMLLEGYEVQPGSSVQVQPGSLVRGFGAGFVGDSARGAFYVTLTEGYFESPLCTRDRLVKHSRLGHLPRLRNTKRKAMGTGEVAL